MSDDLARSRSALIEAWRVHTEAAGGEWIDRDGLFTCFTGPALAMYNPTIAVADGFSDALAAREDEYRRRGVQFGFRAFDSTAAEAKQAASRLGLTEIEPQPSMVLRPVPDFPEPAHVALVEDETMLDELVRVQADGFDEDLDHLRAFTPPSVLKSSERYYLAWGGDVAAAGTGDRDRSRSRHLRDRDTARASQAGARDGRDDCGDPRREHEGMRLDLSGGDEDGVPRLRTARIPHRRASPHLHARRRATRALMLARTKYRFATPADKNSDHAENPDATFAPKRQRRADQSQDVTNPE